MTIPAGSFAKGEVEFQLASLMYDFAVVETERSSLGLQLGAEWAKLKGSVYAEAGEDSYRDSRSETGYAPVVGVRFTTRPSDKWLLNLQGQYLDAGWGDFGDYDGSITRANAVSAAASASGRKTSPVNGTISCPPRHGRMLLPGSQRYCHGRW